MNDAENERRKREKAQKEKREEAEKEERRVAARLERRKGRRRPFYFVILALGAWWLLAVLADVVITCVPGGPPCRAPQIADSINRLITPARWSEFSQAGATGALSKYEWPLLLLALVAALWWPSSGISGHRIPRRVH